MNQHPEVALTGLKIFITLGIILVCLFAVSYLLKRHILKSKDKKYGRLINIIENKYLGVKKNILAVQIPNAILIIGLTGDKICLLDKIVNYKELERNKNQSDNGKQFSDYLNNAD
ncbi:hypothetical protein PITCH_A1500005 [uncultured Desulfobacterium sp.]|uniref:Flagellar protein n=1 Tax=uncultured Desulfobacterium sp. TaxID=201089 RepID=A0A445MTK0_9BACT|nr:hypothetical protein PITCH_A1500005 [uncultured Desulfobacterium sp.]